MAVVEHKKFGIGAVMEYANGIAKIKFKKKGKDGKFIRSVSVEYLTGDVMAFSAPDVSPPAFRSVDPTAAERAMRDFLVGIYLHDSGLCLRGFYGMLTIGRKACQGLSLPNGYVQERVVRLKGSNRGQLIRVVNDAYDRTVDYIMLCITGDKDGKRPNCQYMWRHIRNKFISDIRKATAQKRKQPQTLSYNDAMGTFRGSSEGVDRTPDHRCHVCRTAFYAKRKDAKHCSERCQKRAERKKA